jgi:hypothetical protein
MTALYRFQLAPFGLTGMTYELVCKDGVLKFNHSYIFQIDFKLKIENFKLSRHPAGFVILL